MAQTWGLEFEQTEKLNFNLVIFFSSIISIITHIFFINLVESSSVYFLELKLIVED